MNEVKLGPATMTSFRKTTVAIAVAIRPSATRAASGKAGAVASSASAPGAPIGSMIALPMSITPVAATRESAGGRWRARIVLMA
jgi:hypothetical protein